MKQKILSAYNTAQAWANMETEALALYHNICHRRNLRCSGQTIAKLSRIQRRLVGSEVAKKSRLTK